MQDVFQSGFTYCLKWFSLKLPQQEHTRSPHSEKLTTEAALEPPFFFSCDIVSLADSTWKSFLTHLAAANRDEHSGLQQMTKFPDPKWRAKGRKEVGGFKHLPDKTSNNHGDSIRDLFYPPCQLLTSDPDWSPKRRSQKSPLKRSLR